MLYVAKTHNEKLRDVASKIILVDPNSKPSPELIERYWKYVDTNVSEQTVEEWYCLLRHTQGDLTPYNDDLEHMIDNHEFLHNSLFCEWAYIINVDTGKFEAYQGFNKDPSAPGRYASSSRKGDEEYQGVALIKEIPIVDIKENRIDDFVKELEEIDESEED